MKSEPTHRWRLRFQFSLRLFVVMTLVLGITLGFYGPTLWEVAVQYFEPPSPPSPPIPVKVAKPTSIVITTTVAPAKALDAEQRIYEAEQIDMMQREERFFGNEIEVSPVVPIRSP